MIAMAKVISIAKPASIPVRMIPPQLQFLIFTSFIHLSGYSKAPYQGHHNDDPYDYPRENAQEKTPQPSIASEPDLKPILHFQSPSIPVYS